MSKEDSQRPPLQPGSPLYDTPIRQQPVLSGEHQASSPPTLFTEQGRLTLYWHWAGPRFADGRLERGRRYTQQEKTMLFADWLRTLVADGILDPREHLPAYRVFAGIPFTLKEKHVAQAIRQLRDERVLPNRKMRKDKGQPQWTKRDVYWLTGRRKIAKGGCFPSREPWQLSIGGKSRNMQFIGVSAIEDQDGCI